MNRTLAVECNGKVGQKATLFGWVNSIRDHGKITFIDLRDISGVIQTIAKEDFGAGCEDVVKIEGTVKNRPQHLINENIETGKIEIEIEKLEIINKSKTPPFPIDTDGLDIEESLRLKYRYLDLRRERLQKNLRLRHKMISFMRQFLTDRGFMEIETPILTKATPEGARDFLVPSRLQPGKFYALPQSPQQYKQLLMVAGFEKYFQIARCFRDEDPRADRAYGEFSQLDIEMSFVKQEDILKITEELFKEITEKVFKKKVLEYPFPRITHKEALEKYHADKFDMRPDKDPNVLAFAFVVDFPLFESTPDQPISPSHHPFTAPHEEDIALLDKDPMKARSYQHDLICNGLEVGGGSIRISNPDLQRKIFEILGYKKAEIEEKFGHLLEAFTYGVPPHGGIAPGIERLLMVATNEENTREVTAFPMTSSGQTSVMDAPSPVDEKTLKELKLKKL
jgi:aspartyl-tRNA synthetase